jgi:hypothetical protein
MECDGDVVADFRFCHYLDILLIPTRLKVRRADHRPLSRHSRSGHRYFGEHRLLYYVSSSPAVLLVLKIQNRVDFIQHSYLLSLCQTRYSHLTCY